MNRKKKGKAARIRKAEFITAKDTAEIVIEKAKRVGIDLMETHLRPIVQPDESAEPEKSESLPIELTAGDTTFKNQKTAAEAIGRDARTLRRWKTEGMPTPGGLYLLSILRAYDQHGGAFQATLVQIAERTSQRLIEIGAQLTAEVQELVKRRNRLRG